MRTGRIPKSCKRVCVMPRIPCFVVTRLSGVQPNEDNNSISPEHVCAPESANVVVVTGVARKFGGRDNGTGTASGSVMTSMVIVISGGGKGACFSNLVPFHSMCGTAAAAGWVPSNWLTNELDV